MSSSTESISKGEEKKGNSKDEMPKVTSTMETNSKGARPKTRSTSDKCKKETVEKEQLLKVLIMNTSGDNQGKGTAERRKQTIIDVIKGHNPDLVLFQEFPWQNIKGSKWPKNTVVDDYELIASDNTKIMYNINKFTVEMQRDLQRILEELQRATSKQQTPIPLDFDPIPRMCLRVVKAIDEPNMKFICISWHGRNEPKSTKDTKVTEFTHLMIFLNKIYVKFQKPILIAGDFNVKMELICHEVKDPFKLYEYEASERRKKKGVIDYFIATTELDLPDITPVDLKNVSKADKPEEVLDHDPIIAMLELASLSDTAPAQDEITVTFKGLKLD